MNSWDDGCDMIEGFNSPIEYGITMDCYTNMNLFLEDQRDHIIYVFVVLHAGNATAICVGN